MVTIISNCVTVKDPSPELVEWCKKHLVIKNPEYAKKSRMHFWTGNTPEKLFLYEVNGDSLILPFGTLRAISPYIDTPFNLFKPAIKVDYGEPIPLYDYQRVAVARAYLAQYGILQSPAGSGKTQMGIELIRMWGRRALWLTHTKDLLKQSRDRAEKYMDKKLMGTITEGRVSIGEGITFATIQTMCNLDLERYKNEWDVIIVDECHRVCGSPTAVTQFSKVLNALAARHKYGLSATVHRADGMIAATYALLGDIVYSVPKAAVADKVMQVGVKPVATNVQLNRDCLNTDGTINFAKMVNYLTTNADRNSVIVEWIVRNADKPSLILSDRLEHLELLMGMLPENMKADAVMVSGKMTSKKGKAAREQAIENMRIGVKKYLFATYALAKEGLDIPCLERLYLTTPQKDYAVITQSIGRIARIYPGKGNAIAYDFVDDSIYLVKAYKKRCTTYRKCDCYEVGGQNV